MEISSKEDGVFFYREGKKGYFFYYQLFFSTHAVTITVAHSTCCSGLLLPSQHVSCASTKGSDTLTLSFPLPPPLLSSLVLLLHLSIKPLLESIHPHQLLH